MTESPTSAEQPRLQTLEQYELLEMPHDPALDDIVRLAAQITNAPVAAITLVEKNRVSFMARHGLDITEAERYTLPCETTLEGDGIYQIPDARRDPDFAPGGIPIGDRRYRFYAGAPIVMPSGAAIGCLCVYDTTARKLNAAQLESLDSLSQMIVTRLELNVRARAMDKASRARQRVEGALRVERNFVSAVLDTVGALVVVFDTAGRIVRFNRACETISGYPSGELVGKYAWERLIPAEDIRENIERFHNIRTGKSPTDYENFWVAADGTRRRISWSATTLTDTQGQVTFVIATGIDVTVQRVAEAAIRESEARYRQLVEGSLGMVFTHDLDGIVLSINAHGAQGIGLRIEDVVGHSLTTFIDPERVHLLQPYFASLLATGEAQGLLHMRHVNGEARVMAYRNRLIEEFGRTPYVLAFGIDITEQVRAEEQLRALIRQSNSVLESVGDGIYGIDLEGRVTVVNTAAAQMLGYRPEEILGRKMHELIHHTHVDGTPYPQEDCPIERSLTQRETIRVSNEIFWRKDGTSFPVEYVARPQIESEIDAGEAELTSRSLSHSGQLSLGLPESPVESIHTEEELSPGDGRAVGVVVAFTDISERNALDRMKDEFISTVSHELRTPLTSLRAALGLVAGGSLMERPEKMSQMMNIAIGNTDRLVRLVNDILDLESIGSGKAELHSTMCSMGDLFRRTTSLMQTSAIKANIRFVIEPNGVSVWADPDRILQTLTNLISNAIKFSPNSGPNPAEIILCARYATGGQAIIEVRDEGRGIPEDKLEIIFDRFKQVDASDSRLMGGTGLGLAICRSIVTQHGGTIWATSTLGKGSTLHFTLPTHPSNNLR